MTRSLLTLLVLFLPACERGNTPGENGRAEFEFGDCIANPTGACPLQAIAAGASANVVVFNYNDLPAFEVSSSDPLVALFQKQGPNEIHAQALSPGIAELVLTEQGSGSEIDRVKIKVAAPAFLAMTNPERGGQLVLMEGGEVVVDLEMRDAAGETLVGKGAICYASDPGLSALSVPSYKGALHPTLGEQVAVAAISSGRHELRLSSGLASATLVVIVPVQEEIAKLEVKSATVELKYLNEDYVWATAMLADGSIVYGPVVAWSSSDPGCIEIEAGRSYSDGQNAYTAVYPQRRKCSAQVSATIGSRTATLRLAVQ